jgi:hypothetical protein
MTDTTLAERLARCVKPLEAYRDAPTRFPTPVGFYRIGWRGCSQCDVDYGVVTRNDERVFEKHGAEEAELIAAAQADYTARILAALDVDALAQEVEAMVLRFADIWDTHRDPDSDYMRGKVDAAVEIATAIRAREGGKP